MTTPLALPLPKAADTVCPSFRYVGPIAGLVPALRTYYQTRSRA